MNKRYLITPSLYNSYIYYVGTDFEKYGDKASEIEAKAKQDFINCLSKIYTSNEILERGIAFENSVNDICNGLPVEPMENAKDVADIVGKGIWQQKLCKTVGDYVLYGKADVIDWQYIIDHKCPCWFWDYDFSYKVMRFLRNIEIDLNRPFLDENHSYWKNCRPVRRDEVTFYEDRKDDKQKS